MYIDIYMHMCIYRNTYRTYTSMYCIYIYRYILFCPSGQLEVLNFKILALFCFLVACSLCGMYVDAVLCVSISSAA